MTYRKLPQLWGVTQSARSACFSAAGRAKRRPVEELELQILLPSQQISSQGSAQSACWKQRQVAIDGERAWKNSLQVQWKFPEFYAGGRCLKSGGSKLNFSMIARALFEYEIKFPLSRRHTTISANCQFSMTFKQVYK